LKKRKAGPLVIALFLPLLIFAVVVPLYAQSPAADEVLLTDEQGEYPLGLHLEILEDKDSKWDIDEVTSRELDPKFIPSQDAIPNFGFSDSAFWVRFTVRNETEETTDWQLAFQRTTNPFFVDVYIPSSDQQDFVVTKTGWLSVGWPVANLWYLPFHFSP